MEDTNETVETVAPAKPKAPRGFQLMTPERRAEISSIGGKAAHKAGTAHEFTKEEARAAGRKGGKASGVRRRKAA